MSLSNSEDKVSSKRAIRENESKIWISNEDKELAKKLFPNKSFKESYSIMISEYQKCQELKTELDRFKSSEPSLKEITTNFDGHCSKCSSLISAGSRGIMWGKDVKGNTILICVDCQINAESDRTIVKRLMKRKELDRENRALEKEQTRLLSQIEELHILETLKEYLFKAEAEGKTLEKDKLSDLIRMVTDLVDLKTGKIIKPVKTSYNGANAEKPMKECLNCGEKFVPKNRDQKYCSSECRYDADIDKRRVHGNSMGSCRETPVGYDPFREPFNR